MIRNIEAGLLIAGLVFLTSCGHPDSYDYEVRRLDSVADVIRTDLSLMDELDRDSLQILLDRFKQMDKDLIALYREGDTSSFWKNEYGNVGLCKKGISRYLEEYAHIREQMNVALVQIENLSHDLKHDLIQNDTAETYVNIEIQQAEMILRNTAKRGNKAEYCYHQAQSILAKSDSLINYLNSGP